jgi:hypothetical protein
MAVICRAFAFCFYLLWQMIAWPASASVPDSIRVDLFQAYQPLWEVSVSGPCFARRLSMQLPRGRQWQVSCAKQRLLIKTKPRQVHEISVSKLELEPLSGGAITLTLR